MKIKLSGGIYIANSGVIRESKTGAIVGYTNPPTMRKKLAFLWSELKKAARRQLAEAGKAAAYSINR